jgi:hypothetical protein
MIDAADLQALAGITMSRAYRIHADGRLIGFVWREGGMWFNSRSSERFRGRHTAAVALVNYDRGRHLDASGR